MDQDLKKQIEARFLELPEDVQRAIKSADVDKKIQDISRTHQLHIDQTGTLGDETLMVMMGFADVNEFVANIQKHVNTTPEKAAAIAGEISTALFVPIRQSMQQFMEERALRKTLTTPEPATTPAPVPPIPPPPLAPAVQKPAPPQPPLAPAPKPPTPPAFSAADVILSEKTVAKPPAPPAAATVPPEAAPTAPKPPQTPPAPAQNTAVKPEEYKKVDPYREPPI